MSSKSFVVATIALTVSSVGLYADQQKSASSATPATTYAALVQKYCVGCHNSRLRTGGLALDSVDFNKVGQNPEIWEKVVTKLRVGQMPPSGMPRPDEKTSDQFRQWVQGELDRAAAAHPDPGRTEAFHRLNRTEYQNAVRDLLAINIPVADLLPADDSSNGFDNMAGTLRISEPLMERYLSAAKAVSRMAVGAPLPAVDSKAYRIAPDLQQFHQVEGLPFGTRGGLTINHLFPRAADYDIKVELTGTRGAFEPQQLEISLDERQVKLFTIAPKKQVTDLSANSLTDKYEARVHVDGGPHEVWVTFFRKPSDLVEQAREPFPNPRISGNDGGAGGPMPDITGVTIVGPYNDAGPGNTPSRQKVFACYPKNTAEEPGCAKTILSRLAHLAYRGPVAPEDLQVLMKFYNDGRSDGGSFDNGIEMALRRLLASPEFLFRVESDPAALVKRASVATGASGIYRLNDLELASRISFFLWSSIPDEELLNVAEQGKLHDPMILEKEVRRMIADPRSKTLTTNFAAQWLQLRNLDISRPGDPFDLAYDETLKSAFEQETQLFFDSIVRDDRPTIELLTANYTFVNERLATHYGIPGIQGPEFRKIILDADSPRRGLLGQGSILTITSHPNRTSPVLRGKWILKVILGTPPPDPPPNVPALKDDKTQAKVETMREQMARHRANEPCATCHRLIDPAGFALENFDAIGRWRTVDESFNKIDASGALPDGSKFKDVTELRTALTRRPERFVSTVTQNLLTYALGRGLETYDMPAVRKIVADASRNDYRFQSLILGVIKSYPFLNRRAEGVPQTKSSGVIARALVNDLDKR